MTIAPAFSAAGKTKSKSQLGANHAFYPSTGPRVLVSVLVHRWPSLQHSPLPRPSPFLLLPRRKRSSIPRRRETRPRSRLLLLRRLSLRLRPQRRPRSPLRRRRPRPHQASHRPHPRLPGANSRPDHPSLSTRIHQRLRHRRLAPSRPPLRNPKRLTRHHLPPPRSHASAIRRRNPKPTRRSLRVTSRCSSPTTLPTYWPIFTSVTRSAPTPTRRAANNATNPRHPTRTPTHRKRGPTRPRGPHRCLTPSPNPFIRNTYKKQGEGVPAAQALLPV